MEITDPDLLDARIERLVEQVLRGRCLPFLGAGISQGAPGVFEPGLAAGLTLNAGKIAARLAELLLAWLDGREGSREDHPFERLLAHTSRHDRRELPEGGWSWSPQRSVDRLLDGSGSRRSEPADVRGRVPGDLHAAIGEAWPEVPPLGEVAELCWSTIGPTKTVEALRLELWREHFSPTAAHHYLAILIREGFITELLETNYDPFVERAVEETYGRDPERRGSPASVIHDLQTYRRFIGALRRDGSDDELVRVVKLNGCGEAWAEAKRASGPDSAARLERASLAIGLTEEQLQGWPGKSWARDLLQVRTRSASLFFVGFAGADPLVRHHVLAVLREFRESDPGDDRRDDSPGWWERPNAPFMMEYKNALNFAQFQLLRAFRDAHVRDGAPAEVHRNAFLGDDGPGVRRRLGRDPGGEVLPADDLLALVAARATERHLCDRVLSRSSALHAYLLGALQHPESALALLRQALRAPVDDGPTLWTTWTLLDRPSKREQRSSAWATACAALQGKAPGRAGWRPFLASPVKQPMLFVLLLFAQRACRGERALPLAEALRALAGDTSGARADASSLGVRLPLGERRRVIATSQVDDVLRRARDAAVELPAELVVVGLGRGTTVFRRQIQRRQPPGERGSVGSLSVHVVHVVGDLAALQGPDARAGQRVPDAEAHLLALAEDPGAWTTPRRGWREYCVRSA